MSKAWLSSFLLSLSEANVAQAQTCLEAAHHSTHGLGEEWPRAFDAIIRAGWVEGCQQLLDWGVPFPKAKSKSKPSARQWTLARANSLDRAHHLAAPEALFEAPDGRAIEALSGRRVGALFDLLCSPPAPPLTPEEWKSLFALRPSLALEQLEAGRVSPWGGSAACKAMAHVLQKQLLHASTRSSPTTQVLLRHLPGKMASQGASLTRPVLSAIHAETEGKLLKNPSPNRSLDVVVSALGDCGQSVLALQAVATKTLPEDLFILAIRQNSPEVFSSLLKSGAVPWGSRSKTRPDFPGSFDALRSGDIWMALACRINRSPENEAGPWWHLVEALAASPEGIVRLARSAKPAVVQLSRPADRQRFEALAMGARLGRRLPEPAIPTLPTRRRF